MGNEDVFGPLPVGQSLSKWRLSGTYIMGVVSLILVVVFWVGSEFLTKVSPQRSA